MLGVAALLIFVALTLAGYAAVVMARTRGEAEQFIKSRLSTVASVAGETPAAPILRDDRLSAIPALNAMLARLSPVTGMVRMIRQAGLSNRVGEVVLYILLLGCVGLLLGVLLFGNPLISAVLCFAGAALPLLIVQRKRRVRMRLFSEQLPDALDLVRAALQAGHGLLAALLVVADEFPDPVAQEFRVLAEEIRLGMPLRDGLYRLRDRVDDTNVPILVVGILVAQEVGGNLAEVLENITHTIRERFKILRDVQVMTAQGRMSGSVLTLLPIAAGVFMYFLNPTYFTPMLQKQAGLYMLGYAFGSIIIGHFFIRRLVRIRV